MPYTTFEVQDCHRLLQARAEMRMQYADNSVALDTQVEGSSAYKKLAKKTAKLANGLLMGAVLSKMLRPLLRVQVVVRAHILGSLDSGVVLATSSHPVSSQTLHALMQGRFGVRFESSRKPVNLLQESAVSLFQCRMLLSKARRS